LDAPDETLAARSRTGDRGAFEELVRRTGRLVFASLRLDCADSHEAEDLTQETFLVAFRKIGSLDDPKRFRPWLLAIASSVLIDSRRHKARRKRADRPTGALTAEPAVVVSDSPEQFEQQQRAIAALNGLPEEYRRPLALRYLAGCDYESIGKQLGLTNGSLRGLLHRGMALLRERMRE
jgi:RNA polymerase sigma-70 factor (ECF subfamily)